MSEVQEQYAEPSFQQMPQPVFAGHATEGALHYQLEVQNIIEDVEHTLKGEVFLYDRKTGQQRWQTGHGIRPLINDRGINSILMILKSRITKIFILSDLEEKTIENITINIGTNVIDDLYYNWDEYEIKDDAAASLILSLVTDSVYATLRKGYMGNYLKFLRSTQTIQEVQHHATNMRDRGSGGGSIMDKIFKRK